MVKASTGDRVPTGLSRTPVSWLVIQRIANFWPLISQNRHLPKTSI